MEPDFTRIHAKMENGMSKIPLAAGTDIRKPIKVYANSEVRTFTFLSRFFFFLINTKQFGIFVLLFTVYLILNYKSDCNSSIKPTHTHSKELVAKIYVIIFPAPNNY